MSDPSAQTSDFLVNIVDDDLEVARATSLLVGSVGLNAKVFGSAQAFLDEYDPEIPSCLILDVRMPGMSGPELQSFLLGEQVQVPIIFVTGHGDIPTAVRAIKQGAIDVLEKPFNDQVMLDRVFEARRQDSERRMAARQSMEIANKAKLLTARERQVMARIVKGELNKVIAADLGLSIRTIELHRANVLKKMQAKSVAELTKMALQLPDIDEDGKQPT